MDEPDYMDKVKNQIELDKLLHYVKPENKEKVKELFFQKQKIMKKNGFFADFELKKINQKINKLKSDT